MSRNLLPIIRVVALYTGFSVLWILLSDSVAHFLEFHYGFSESIETYKGLAFVLVSAVLLFWLLYRELRLREKYFSTHLEEEEHLLDQLRKKNEELIDAYDRTIFGWSRVLEMRNREVKDHSRRVTDMMLRLARFMKVDPEDLEHIRRGALLHDIGKMAIPDAVILKEGDLTEKEWALVRRHPLFGFEMIQEIEFLRPSVDIMLCHHERWDGTGYPFGLAADQIPLYARMFAVVDVWDALSSEDRSYRKADPPEVALKYLRSQAGSQFDPAIVEIFEQMLSAERQPEEPTQPAAPRSEGA